MLVKRTVSKAVQLCFYLCISMAQSCQCDKASEVSHCVSTTQVTIRMVCHHLLKATYHRQSTYPQLATDGGDSLDVAEFVFANKPPKLCSCRNSACTSRLLLLAG